MLSPKGSLGACTRQWWLCSTFLCHAFTAHRSVGIEKLEPGTFSVMAVHVRVSDVVILFRVELSLDQIELVLQHGECYGYVMCHPDTPLIADRPVGAAADNVSQIFRPSHHLHGNGARRVAHLQSAVYVKTDELRQTSSSFGFLRISLYAIQLSLAVASAGVGRYHTFSWDTSRT